MHQHQQKLPVLVGCWSRIQERVKELQSRPGLGGCLLLVDLAGQQSFYSQFLNNKKSQFLAVTSFGKPVLPLSFCQSQKRPEMLQPRDTLASIFFSCRSWLWQTGPWDRDNSSGEKREHCHQQELARTQGVLQVRNIPFWSWWAQFNLYMWSTVTWDSQSELETEM